MSEDPALASLERLAERLLGAPGSIRIEVMPGGASTRRFFRVELGTRGSAVAMYVPDATRSDEIAKGSSQGRRWPFLEVRDLLEQRGVRVPKLLGEACDDGLILVEDLGDDTLAQFLASNPERRRELYQTAVRDLARAQRALAKLPEGSVVSTRAFDEDLLRWEVDHFREWGLEAKGIRLSDTDAATFAAAAGHLASTIAGWPRTFVHRDYQSRNLMVCPGYNGSVELAWIDFQDALLGPRVYDLVALLSDSYQSFSREFVEQRLDEYATHHDLDAAGRREVGYEFDVVTVQRKLKDAGRFVFIDRVRGNPNFLQFVDPTIEKVRSALGRLSGDPILARLAELLERVLPVSQS
jgi:aminoglycoside/choline kinase family phosphotransferase